MIGQMTAEDGEMGLEERVARIESDLGLVQKGVAELKVEVRELRHEFKGLRSEFQGLRVDMAQELGALRTELRTSAQQNKICLLLIAFAAVCAPIVNALAQALKWF